MNENTILILTLTSIFLGVILIISQMSFSSRKPQTSIATRALVSAIGGTISVTGLVLWLAYRQSPSTFLQEWSILRLIGFTICFIVPIFIMMAAGMSVQLTILEKWKNIGKNLLGKLNKKDDG